MCIRDSIGIFVVMLKIRLARSGAKKKPFFHITVADSRKPRDGKFIERVGYFNPISRGKEVRLEVNQERVDYWLSQGAQISQRVLTLIKENNETVQHASEIGHSKNKAGVKASEVHNAVEDFINSTKYKGRFIHSTGHSIGLNVHDGASISKKSEIILEESMAFTIEPGIYLPKIGGVRIEDDVIVKKGKPEIITKVSRELIEI